MNIFYLHPDPKIAASYHCDQHLGKMILESAQMLSTVARFHGCSSPSIYRSTHENHPCVLLLKSSWPACEWLGELVKELDNIRISLNKTPHASYDIIQRALDYLWRTPEVNQLQDNFNPVYCGPPLYNISSSLYPVDALYREYYQRKHTQWLIEKGKGMTYKNRPIPDFMSSYISAS